MSMYWIARLPFITMYAYKRIPVEHPCMDVHERVARRDRFYEVCNRYVARFDMDPPEEMLPILWYRSQDVHID